MITVRHDAWHDPGLRESLLGLFDTVWPNLRPKEALAASLGHDWASGSTPSVVVEDGVAAAHVGLLPIPMRVEGEDVVVGGIHAVCTRPTHRGRGHASLAMERALAIADARHRTLVLGTDIPDFYARFGFRVQREHVFVADVARPRARGEAFRRVADVRDPGAASWLRLMRERVPMSDRAAFVDPGFVNAFDVVAADGALRDLYVCDEMDVAVYARFEGATLTLCDVIAREVPDVEELLARMPGPFERVVLRFNADRLALPTRAEPWPGDGFYMVRGPFVKESTPFALPPYSEC